MQNHAGPDDQKTDVEAPLVGDENRLLSQMDRLQKNLSKNFQKPQRLWYGKGFGVFGSVPYKDELLVHLAKTMQYVILSQDFFLGIDFESAKLHESTLYNHFFCFYEKMDTYSLIRFYSMMSVEDRKFFIQH